MSRRRIVLKIVVLGESGVGKTSLMCRYVDNKFSLRTKSTIGSDFLSKNLELEGKQISLQIWDTAGQERFQSLGSSFFRGADGVVFVFDVTRANTFECLAQWKESFLIQAGLEGRIDFPMIIVGNKIDDEENRKVSRQRAEEWCKSIGDLQYFETSAKDDLNVGKAYESIAKIIVKGLKEEDVSYETVSLDVNAQKKGGCDC